VLWDMGVKMPAWESTDSHYLALLTEVGPLGFVLFFVFFGKIVLLALRAVRQVQSEMKPLLVGIVAGFTSLLTQDVSDDAWAAHAISALVWLFAALVVVIARRNAELARSSAYPLSRPASSAGAALVNIRQIQVASAPRSH
jgi:O-antigen ligase